MDYTLIQISQIAHVIMTTSLHQEVLKQHIKAFLKLKSSKKACFLKQLMDNNIEIDKLFNGNKN